MQKTFLPPKGHICRFQAWRCRCLSWSHRSAHCSGTCRLTSLFSSAVRRPAPAPAGRQPGHTGFLSQNAWVARMAETRQHSPPGSVPPPTGTWPPVAWGQGSCVCSPGHCLPYSEPQQAHGGESKRLSHSLQPFCLWCLYPYQNCLGKNFGKWHPLISHSFLWVAQSQWWMMLEDDQYGLQRYLPQIHTPKITVIPQIHTRNYTTVPRSTSHVAQGAALRRLVFPGSDPSSSPAYTTYSLVYWRRINSPRSFTLLFYKLGEIYQSLPHTVIGRLPRAWHTAALAKC